MIVVLVFTDTLTLMGQFVSYPREREKRSRRDGRKDERD